ncbi:hypothetical protein ABZ832_04580 [Streptantibioticus parmotrematis]|uniref:hypothetical protein n=1 Tax=Streptantibioticus parmotrematis TaxID=2873249 RepID=UPI0033DE5819
MSTPRPPEASGNPCPPEVPALAVIAVEDLSPTTRRFVAALRRHPHEVGARA